MGRPRSFQLKSRHHASNQRGWVRTWVSVSVWIKLNYVGLNSGGLANFFETTPQKGLPGASNSDKGLDGRDASGRQRK